MIKLLFYSHDSYGLGNIRRMVAIAEFLIRHNHGLSVMLITGSPMLHAFRTNPALDYVKLPCLGRDQEGHYHSKLIGVSHQEQIQLRSQIITQVLKHYQPDLFLVDKKPMGLENELCEGFDYLANSTHQPQTILLLRDILDSPEETSRIWHKNGYFPFIEAHYHKVMIAGLQNVFNATHLYQFPQSIKSKTSYLGYLERSIEGSCLSSSHKPHRQGGTKQVLVTVGGGNDGVAVIRHYLQGLGSVSWRHQTHSVVVCGPEMSHDEYQQLEFITLGLPEVTLLPFTDQLIALLSESDLVIAMAGYNTVCEILSVDRPAILIPRVRPTKEQLIRAQRFSRLEILDYLSPSYLDSKVLMEKVEAKLFGEPVEHGRKAIALNGMKNMNQMLMDLVQS